MSEQNGNLHEFTKGIIKENPTLVTLLGMCPTLAVTTMAENGLGMGLATTFVLVCSNAVISLLKNVIPKAVRHRKLCNAYRVSDEGLSSRAL